MRRESLRGILGRGNKVQKARELLHTGMNVPQTELLISAPVHDSAVHRGVSHDPENKPWPLSPVHEASAHRLAAFPISADPQYLLPTWVPASAQQPAPLETRGDLGSPRLNSPRGDHRQTPPHAPQEQLSPKRGESGTPRSVGGNEKQGSRCGACGGFAKGLVWNNTGLSGPTSGGTPGRPKAGPEQAWVPRRPPQRASNGRRWKQPTRPWPVGDE